MSFVKRKRPADRDIVRKCPLTMMTREALFPPFLAVEADGCPRVPASGANCVTRPSVRSCHEADAAADSRFLIALNVERVVALAAAEGNEYLQHHAHPRVRREGPLQGGPVGDHLLKYQSRVFRGVLVSKKLPERVADFLVFSVPLKYERDNFDPISDQTSVVEAISSGT